LATWGLLQEANSKFLARRFSLVPKLKRLDSSQLAGLSGAVTVPYLLVYNRDCRAPIYLFVFLTMIADLDSFHLMRIRIEH
jgi:hypothetical protein